MKNIKTISIVILFSISVSFLINVLTRDKIAIIKTGEILAKYKGANEARSLLEKKIKIMELNKDTLKTEIEELLKKYDEDRNKLSGKEKDHLENELKYKRSNYIKYSEATNDKVKAEEQMLLEGVFNQINSFMVEYGKKNKYDMILGTTSGGNILYAKETIDITNQVLEELNNSYLNK